VIRAKKATAAAEEVVKNAAVALQAARAEEKAAEHEYNELAQAELHRTKEEEEAAMCEEEAGEVLTQMLDKIGEEKAKLSPELAELVDKARESLSKSPPARSKKKRRARSPTAISSDDVEAVCGQAGGSGGGVPATQMVTPLEIDLKKLDADGTMDDATFGKEVRSRMERSTPY